MGVIKKAWRHPEADSLYIEEVEVGEAIPRQVRHTRCGTAELLRSSVMPCCAVVSCQAMLCCCLGCEALACPAMLECYSVCCAHCMKWLGLSYVTAYCIDSCA